MPELCYFKDSSVLLLSGLMFEWVKLGSLLIIHLLKAKWCGSTVILHSVFPQSSHYTTSHSVDCCAVHTTWLTLLWSGVLQSFQRQGDLVSKTTWATQKMISKLFHAWGKKKRIFWQRLGDCGLFYEETCQASFILYSSSISSWHCLSCSSHIAMDDCRSNADVAQIYTFCRRVEAQAKSLWCELGKHRYNITVLLPGTWT